MTHDLDAANDVIMATKGSNYVRHRHRAHLRRRRQHRQGGGARALRRDVPPFIVVPAMAVNRDNLAQAWQEGFHADPPAEVTAALAK